MNFHKSNQIPGHGWVWVFGSNEAGIHAVGDARIAKNNFGAMYGISAGRVRDSYAIAARDRHMVNLPVATLTANVNTFLSYARGCPGERFFVSRIGCTPGGFKDEDIALLFSNAPENCFLPEGWEPYLHNAKVSA